MSSKDCVINQTFRLSVEPSVSNFCTNISQFCFKMSSTIFGFSNIFKEKTEAQNLFFYFFFILI